MKTISMMTLLVLAATSAIPLLGAAPAMPASPVAIQVNPKIHVYPDQIANMPIEVCFVLDTTGSMSGLIEGAKQKIWSIANDIVKDNPKSPLKIALVAYRDRGDAYITKVVDMTDDLDAMYKELMGFRAEGGGDMPESVNQALQDAVEKVTWTPPEKDAIRLMFLVGDAPPHMDYADDVKYPISITKAVKNGITVDAIQCGNIPDTTPIWQNIADSGHGVFLAIAQSGGMTAISTPQDKRLLELNTELAKTVIPYGTLAQQSAVNGKVATFGVDASGATTAPAEAAAARAVYNNARGGRAVQGAGDLVNDIQADKDLLTKTKDENLPENLQKMSVEERKKFVDTQLAKREELNKEIAKVAQERDAYIKSEMAKAPKTDSFDAKVSDAIRKTADSDRAAAAAREKK